MLTTQENGVNLLVEQKPAYEEEPICQVLERVFDGHFPMVEEAVHSKSNCQLRASSLQYPDDLEATLGDACLRCQINRLGYLFKPIYGEMGTGKSR